MIKHYDQLRRRKGNSVSTSSGEVTRFSTARTTPSFVFNPIAVDPNCKSKGNNNMSITLSHKTHINLTSKGLANCTKFSTACVLECKCLSLSYFFWLVMQWQSGAIEENRACHHMSSWNWHSNKLTRHRTTNLPQSQTSTSKIEWAILLTSSYNTLNSEIPANL